MEEEQKISSLLQQQDQSLSEQPNILLNARLSNNYQFQRAQHAAFSNISSFSKMVAYSLNNNCQSIETSKFQQLEAIISQFKKSNIPDNSQRKKFFRKIIKNRFNADEQQLSDGESEDEEMDDNSEISDQQQAVPQQQQMRQRSQTSQIEVEEDSEYYEYDSEGDDSDLS